MNINAEEQLMYQVMKAIFDSGIPISFKGSMVLKACLAEAGFTEDTRHTVDIDANWLSDTTPTASQMAESIQNALKRGGIDLNVSIYRMFGEGRSAGFELKDNRTEETLFSMDVDVNRPAVPTKIYEIAGLRFSGVTPIQMTADKVSVVSSDKIFRRIKDVIDLYYLSKVFSFKKEEVIRAISNSEKKLGDFNGFLYRQEDLRHSYMKFCFNGNIYKPPFDEVYQAVRDYIKDIYPSSP